MNVYVEVTAPVLARTRLQNDIQLNGLDISLILKTDKARVLTSITAATQTETQYVPTLTSSEDGHAHLYEPPDINADKLLRSLRNLEGAFAAYGMVEVDFTRLKWRWFSAEQLGAPEEHIFAYDSDHEPTEPPLEHIPLELVQLLSFMATNPDAAGDCLTLSLFRRGHNFHKEYRYLEAVWSFLLQLEHAYANGKYQQKDQQREYLGSSKLISCISRAGASVERYIRSGDLSLKTAKDLLLNQSTDKVIRWIIGLRGHLFHQSATRKITWHPSADIEHKAASIVLFSICAEVAQSIVNEWLRKP